MHPQFATTGPPYPEVDIPQRAIDDRIADHTVTVHSAERAEPAALRDAIGNVCPVVATYDAVRVWRPSHQRARNRTQGRLHTRVLPDQGGKCMAQQPLLRELIDIRESISTSDFVLELAKAVTDEDHRG
ncbi:hypothetical protein GCM10011588_64710 [Nocardia jinanensis]|uniref:Uncharacterized protein n=1 Tax=Nocardia jinanensis TaxID=382504 RepID=A0A917VZ01_9NOCA|nr:hypothetical protein GCM10011588_64710 [Nocardia jinanensis]